jgi:LytS/YehU family sensor histidine kinase
VDFLIVGVLVAIGHRRQLAEWLQARTRDTAALGTQLRRARERAARLRSIPPTLLQALDRVAAIVRTEPHRTEHLLARLADYLRVAIECSDDEGVTPERERALGRCLAELEESGGFALTTSRGA